MTWLARIRSLLIGIVRHNRIEQDLADELEFHIEARAADLARRGLPPAEAVRQARIEFGAAERYKDECRESRGLRLINDLRADLLYAARGLRRSPGFAVIVVLSLALGIGANTAMFSIVNGVLLRPLPYRDADRLVVIEERMPESIYSMKATRRPREVNFLFRQNELQSFEEIMAIDDDQWRLLGVDEPESLAVGQVTGNVCSFLGVQPWIGRCFTPEEETAGSPVTMLSYELWQRQFHGETGVLGQSISLTGPTEKSYTMVGVMPPGVRPMSRFDVWVPISESRNYRRRLMSWQPEYIIARLKPHVKPSQARAEMLAMQRRLYPTEYEGAGGTAIRATPLVDYLAQHVKAGLAVLLAIVGLVLLITCTNVANLLLSRGAARVREIAVRASLGAGRLRICRQLVTEALVLAVIGGALGLMAAHWIVRGVKALQFQLLPRVNDIRIDPTVLAFTAAVSILSGVLFGLLPALRLSRVDLADAMKSGGAGAIGGRRQQRVMNGLVIFEAALCVVAMVGAGLLITTFIRLKGVDPGYRADHLLVLSLDRPDSKFAQILERVRGIPGVQAATLTNNPPPYPVRNIQRFNVNHQANSRPVSPDYFRTMSIPLRRGRTFNEHDQPNSRLVVVINEGMARRYWPTGDALGQTIVLDGLQKGPAEIVGIVGDVRQVGPREAPDDMIYTADTQSKSLRVSAIIVRTRGEPSALVSALKQEIRAIDRNQTFGYVNTMTELMAAKLAEPRFYMILLGSYGVLALALTTLGIGGLVAYSVSRRTQEIGLRISFGATRLSLLRMFAGGSLKLIAAGLVIGIPASLAVTRFMRTLLYEVTPSDPATFTVVALVLTGVSLVASAAAALRATSIEPTAVLRHE